MKFKGIFSAKKFSNLPIKRKKQKLCDWCDFIIQNKLYDDINNPIMLSFLDAVNIFDDEKLNKVSAEFLNNCSIDNFYKIHFVCFELLNKQLKDNDIIVFSKDGTKPKQNKAPIVIVLDNLRSSFNTGSITRTCECANIQKVIFCGTSPSPNNPKTAKICMQTSKYIAWETCESTLKAISKLKKNGYTVYAMETALNAKNLYNTKVKTPLAIVFGNEALGISLDVLKQCDEIIKIPMHGWKNSLNVGVSCGIALFEILNKIGSKNG